MADSAGQRPGSEGREFCDIVGQPFGNQRNADTYGEKEGLRRPKSESKSCGSKQRADDDRNDRDDLYDAVELDGQWARGSACRLGECSNAGDRRAAANSLGHVRR